MCQRSLNWNTIVSFLSRIIYMYLFYKAKWSEQRCQSLHWTNLHIILTQTHMWCFLTIISLHISAFILFKTIVWISLKPETQAFSICTKRKDTTLIRKCIISFQNWLFIPPLQAGHWTAAGLSHPSYWHRQAEWVPVDVQRTSGQPGHGPSSGFTQTLYSAGTMPIHLYNLPEQNSYFIRWFSFILQSQNTHEWNGPFIIFRLPSNVQMSVTHVGFGNWADSGVRGCVRNSTGRVSRLLQVETSLNTK